jgi:chromate transport protein ChrA
MDLTNLGMVLLWIAGIGAPSIVAYVLSWVVENWKVWSTLPKEVKFLTPMIVSVLLSIGAAQLLNYPDVIAQIQPWFQVVMASVLAYLASQKAYVTAISRGYGARFSRPDSKNVQIIDINK